MFFNKYPRRKERLQDDYRTTLNTAPRKNEL